jgi:Domain of unknown function (DUF4844)
MLAFELKVIGAVVLAGLIIFAVGLTGALFAIWPTFWPHQNLTVTSAEFADLRALRAERKFMPDARLGVQAALDELLDTLIRDVAAHPTKAFVLARIKVVLAGFPVDDSEDRDRLLGYLERTMEILRVNGSNELLNVWRYGFPYGWFWSHDG